MNPSKYDYGKWARIGIATPQANPTVEPEFSVLFPRTVSIQASRLTSRSTDSKTRLKQYLEDLESTLNSYGGMPLDAFGFACTASAYILGADYEDSAISKLSDQMGYPVETASRSIFDWLTTNQCEKICVVMPYPDPMIEAAQRYWASRGITVTHVLKLQTGSSNTTSIYDLSSSDAAAALSDLNVADCDAVLLSGTGMPTLSCLANIDLKVPLISSNYCLAWRLLERAGVKQALSGNGCYITGWHTRLAEVLLP